MYLQIILTYIYNVFNIFYGVWIHGQWTVILWDEGPHSET